MAGKHRRGGLTQFSITERMVLMMILQRHLLKDCCILDLNCKEIS